MLLTPLIHSQKVPLVLCNAVDGAVLRTANGVCLDAKYCTAFGCHSDGSKVTGYTTFQASNKQSKCIL
jgi:predicted CxxxxCH...CXXCH cytochrome family protein